MDVQNSMRWGETLHREKMAKLKWKAKYLTPEEQQREADEEAAAIAELSSTISKPHTGRSERDMMEMRLVGLDEELAALNIEPPVRHPPKYELMRRQVAERVKANTFKSHRITGDLSIESMLRDIGPGLWVSTNPGYTDVKQASTMQTAHVFYQDQWWGAKVDKKHHMKRDEFMIHCEKSLQLGEKVFVSGGMKSK